MKQKLYTLALAACASLFPAVASANLEQVSIFDNLKFTPNNKVEFMKESPEMMRAAAPQAPFLTEANMTRTNYDRNFPYYLSSVGLNYSGALLYGNKLVEYIPEMDVVVYKDFNFEAKFKNNAPDKGIVKYDVLVFKDGGVTLSDSTNAFTIENDLSVMGHVKILNTDKTNTDISKCSFVYFANIFFDYSDRWTNKGYAAYLFKDGKMQSVVDQEKFHTKEGYQRDAFEFLGAYTKDDEIHFYSSADFGPESGISLPREEPHFLVGEFSKGSFETEITTSFNTTFIRPEEGLLSKGQVVMDDYNGKIYYYSVAPFIGQAEGKDYRTPAVTVSDDDGYSYNSDFEKMPRSVLVEFMKNNNMIPNGMLEIEIGAELLSYRDLAFRVYGEDKMSAITTLYLTNLSENKKLLGYYLVEIIKDGANWSMKLIEDLSCKEYYEESQQNQLTVKSPRVLVIENENPTTNLDPIPGKPFQVISSPNPRSWELDLATTKDNKQLVAKWIEYTYDKKYNVDGKKYYDSSAVKTEPYTLYYTVRGNLVPIEENLAYSNQIMVSYRDIEGGNWSEPVPLTVGREPNYYLHTSMPKVIPSINNIPMFYTSGNAFSEENIPEVFKDAPFWKENLVTYKTLPELAKRNAWVITRVFRYGNFNIEAKEDVEETIIPNENGIGVFPNPATSEMTIKIDSQTSATVEVYNMIGAKVMSFNGVVSAVTANVSNLGNGMYMIKVIENGNVRTSSFTIAR